MYIDKLHSRFLHHLTIPFSISVVPAFYLSLRPFVTWSERNEDWCGTLFPNILNEFLQIPPERIDSLVFPAIGKTIDVTCILRTGNGSTLLLRVNRTSIIMSELNENEVSWLQTVIHLFPTSFIEEGSRASSCLGTIHASNLAFVKDGICL